MDLNILRTPPQDTFYVIDPSQTYLCSNILPYFGDLNVLVSCIHDRRQILFNTGVVYSHQNFGRNIGVLKIRGYPRKLGVFLIRLVKQITLEFRRIQHPASSRGKAEPLLQNAIWLARSLLSTAVIGSRHFSSDFRSSLSIHRKQTRTCFANLSDFTNNMKRKWSIFAIFCCRKIPPPRIWRFFTLYLVIILVIYIMFRFASSPSTAIFSQAKAKPRRT